MQFMRGSQDYEMCCRKKKIHDKIYQVIMLLHIEEQKTDELTAFANHIVGGSSLKRSRTLINECKAAKESIDSLISELVKCLEIESRISCLKKSQIAFSGANTFMQGRDVYGNETILDPEGHVVYYIGKDIFGNKAVWDSNGNPVYHVGKDYLGNETVWDSDGQPKYHIGEDIYGNETIWDSEGEAKAWIGRDIFGNDAIRGK